MVAQKHIAKLPVFSFQMLRCEDNGKEENDSDLKCLVCQCEYEQDRLRRYQRTLFPYRLRRSMVENKDFCLYCRQTIVSNDSPHHH
jgi:hypothetical protein